VTTEEKIDRLTTIVDALAATVVAHDNQIEAVTANLKTLAQIVEKHDAELKTVVHEWQAYLRRLPPQ
jgi:ABC-type transporter Mla subunit MlaD